MKNFLLIIIITNDSIISRSPRASGLPRNAGTGHPSIGCPIEKYMSTIRIKTDDISLFFSTGVSLSFSASFSAAYGSYALSEAPDLLPALPPASGSLPAAPAPPALPAPGSARSDAPYPASSTALMISDASAVPSTPIEFVSRLTEHDSTPGTLETAFSTCAWQAAQLIPVTSYCCIYRSFLSTKSQRGRRKFPSARLYAVNF